MTASAKSVFYFGIYAILVGVLACLIPAQLTELLGLPEIPLAWARVMGLVVIIIGVYDIISGLNNLMPMIKATVYMRLFFFAGTIALFASGQMSKEILLIGFMDFAGALWTIIALKME